MGKHDVNEREFTVIGELNEECSALLIHNFKPFSRLIKVLQGKTLEISFKILRYVRSDAQNRYMWGVIVPCVRAWFKETTGQTKSKEAIYVWLRKSLLGHELTIEEVGGEEIIILKGKRFSEMNTKEFTEAVEHIRAEMLERGCNIPEPTKNNFLSDFLNN